MSLYRKYRPQRFKDLVNQEHIKTTLLKSLKRKRISHAYLFAGPRGTGKTTVARLLAKALNCSHRNPEPCNRCLSCKEHMKLSSLDLIEIDAASNRGIDEIRELRERIKLAPSSSEYKIFIIDEVHMLTTEAFNALLKTLEEPPAHAIFILATTEPHKVPATVLSRCQRFDFVPLSIFDIVLRLKKIAASEGINYDEDALKMIAAAASGGLRDAISILDQLASVGKKISVPLIQKTLGVVSERAILKLFEALIYQDVDAGFEAITKINEKGYNLIHFRKTLLDFLRRVLVYKISGEEAELKGNYSKEIYQKIIGLSQEVDVLELIRIIKVIARDSLIEKDTLPSLGLEIAVVELAKKSAESPAGQSGGSASMAAERPLGGGGIKKRTIAIKMGDFKELWSKFLEAIKPHNHSLAAILRLSRILGINNNHLILEVDFDFHRQKIEDKINISAIERALKETFGKPLKVECHVGKQKENEKSLKDIALEVFE